MKKEKTCRIRKVGNFLEIDGEWYFPKMHSPIDSGKTLIFKKVDKETIKGNILFLAKTLKPFIDKNMILEDALSDMKPIELHKLTETMKTGKKPKVIRRYGCVELKVGAITIPIR